MKNKSNGFTLAEVLITLGIIGVVARITLPALLDNVSTQSTVTSLLKAVNTLEVGNQRIIASGGSKSLSCNNDFTEDLYLSMMNKYFNGILSTETVVIDGSNYNQAVFKTKDGITFTKATGIKLEDLSTPTVGGTEIFKGDFETGDKGNSRPLEVPYSLTTEYTRIIPDKYHGSFVALLVDINGQNSPNKLAEDQFVFVVDNYGSVIPYGGKEYGEYALSGTSTTSGRPTAANCLVPLDKYGYCSSYEVQYSDPETGTTSGRAVWRDVCNESTLGTKKEDRAACTGSIFDNGNKIIY